MPATRMRHPDHRFENGRVISFKAGALVLPGAMAMMRFLKISAARIRIMAARHKWQFSTTRIRHAPKSRSRSKTQHIIHQSFRL
ncbi:MAG: hypothetical protein WD032_03920, partial [Nitrospirales bacterium]